MKSQWLLKLWGQLAFRSGCLQVTKWRRPLVLRFLRVSKTEDSQFSICVIWRHKERWNWNWRSSRNKLILCSWSMALLWILFWASKFWRRTSFWWLLKRQVFVCADAAQLRRHWSRRRLADILANELARWEMEAMTSGWSSKPTSVLVLLGEKASKLVLLLTSALTNSNIWDGSSSGMVVWATNALQSLANSWSTEGW